MRCINRRHSLPEWLARWLLMAHDRSKRDLTVMSRSTGAACSGSKTRAAPKGYQRRNRPWRCAAPGTAPKGYRRRSRPWRWHGIEDAQRTAAAIKWRKEHPLSPQELYKRKVMRERKQAQAPGKQLGQYIREINKEINHAASTRACASAQTAEARD
jgi:hypothetical protein